MENQNKHLPYLNPHFQILVGIIDGATFGIVLAIVFGNRTLPLALHQRRLHAIDGPIRGPVAQRGKRPPKLHPRPVEEQRRLHATVQVELRKRPVPTSRVLRALRTRAIHFGAIRQRRLQRPIPVVRERAISRQRRSLFSGSQQRGQVLFPAQAEGPVRLWARSFLVQLGFQRLGLCSADGAHARGKVRLGFR